MTGLRFVDTNVLIYSIGASGAHEFKMRQARALLDQQGLALSVQVLQEFYVQITRETRNGSIPHEEAVAHIVSLHRYPVQEMTIPLLHAALASKQRFQISYWDAAIIEAARMLGCKTVLTEDLHHGQDYDGVRAVNPFLEA